jgi:uncharacterized protein
MAEEPELKSTTKQKIINPLMMAWAFVLVLLSLTVIWTYYSEDPTLETADPIIAENSTTPEVVIHEQAETSNDPSPSNMDSAASLNDASTQQNPEDGLTPEPVTMPALSDNAAEEVISPQISDQQKLEASQIALKPAPNENLLIRGDNGLKPVLGPDGLIAWQEYARPYQENGDAPRIAILITDVGLNSKNSTSAIDNLPGPIDLAFSPYGRNLQTWMDKARAKGHEGFLMIPTEPLNYPDNDPGPHTLISDFSERDNLLRLDWVLSQVTGYVGVVNHMGSKFTASEEALTPVLHDLQDRGLMFLDARSTRFSMAARIARRINMPRAINDRYLDNVLSSTEISRQLGELEKTATTFGAAVGLASATPLTIKEIAAWALSLEEKGIELVPVTAIANRQPIK